VIEGLKNNTLGAIREWMVNQIKDQYDLLEAQAIGKVVLEHFLKVTANDFFLKKEQRYNESKIVTIYKAIKKLRQNIPVQYITGESEFRGLTFSVNPDVLIPRPETEELVQWIVEDYQSHASENELYIWDIGTGSGAIAISIKSEVKNANVWGSDISKNALETAQRNAIALEADIEFFLHDILSGTLPDQFFDCIVSNPPYIRDSEKVLMHKNVLDHEPRLALFVPDEDPLIFYRAISLASIKSLKPGGSLYFEINEAHGGDTKDLLENVGFMQIEIKKDLHGKNRFVKAVKK
jgi:release factor glutamine methyltransferase